MQFGVSLPLPIIDRSRGRRQEARAETAAAGAKLAAIEQQLLRDWRTASQRLRTAAQQVTAYRERILPKANEALRLVQRGFEEGKFRFIDLLDTQRTAAEARLGYQQKLLELNIAQANIEALLTHAPGENNAARGAQAQETTNDL
jgi:cobalt-zinc-cadmium efflux system outer membrane protein